MALSVGNVVSMTLQASLGTSGLLGPLVQVQPPHFGVVAATGTGTVDVLWEDGRLTTAIPEAALDLIGAPNAGVVSALQGFILEPDPTTESQQESPEYQGIAVAFYTRSAQVAQPTVSATLVLMYTNVGTYRELLASALAVVQGR